MTVFLEPTAVVLSSVIVPASTGTGSVTEVAEVTIYQTITTDVLPGWVQRLEVTTVFGM